MTDDELIARALQLLAARAAGATAPSITLAQLYAKYEAANRSRKSWWAIEDKLQSVIAALGSRDVMSLRILDWSDYRADRSTTPVPNGKGRCYGAHSINCELQWLKAVLNWGVAQGRIPHNPLAAAKGERARSQRTTAPREDDIERLLERADPRARVVVLCAADGGMRRGEIRTMRWDWISAEEGAIHLPGWACKSGRARTVPATKRMLDAIASIPRHVRSSVVLANPETGEPYRPGTISKWFRLLADIAGLEAAPDDVRVRLHDARHGFASNAARRGVRIEVVSKMLGHASLDQTRTYVQTGLDDLTEARETFEAGILRDQARRGPRRVSGAPPSDADEKSKHGGK